MIYFSSLLDTASSVFIFFLSLGTGVCDCCVGVGFVAGEGLAAGETSSQSKSMPTKTGSVCGFATVGFGSIAFGCKKKKQILLLFYHKTFSMKFTIKPLARMLGHFK